MKLENLGFMPRRVFPHVEISSVGCRCFPRTETGIPRSIIRVDEYVCVGNSYGNEMCVYCVITLLHFPHTGYLFPFYSPIEPSRRGDIEILGYCLLQWACGVLPWEGHLQDNQKVASLKRR